MHILFLTDNFPPETNAPASRTYEHAREWVKRGTKVTVITCAPNFPYGQTYSGYKNRLWQSETIDNIRVIRVWTYMAENKGFIWRLLDFVSFAISSFLASFFVRRVDAVIGTSPQFFTVISAWAVSFIKRVPFIFELRDLWPESIKAVGMDKLPWLLGIFERIELFLYRKADSIITVTNSFKANLIERGICAGKIFVVTNGVDLEDFSPRSKNQDLIQKLHCTDKFIVGYIGTHGLAHSLETIIDAAEYLQFVKNIEDIHFVFVGDGAAKVALVNRATVLKLQNVDFVNSVSKKEVVEYWSILDTSIVHLKKTNLFKTVIPSKIFECMAMEVPIILGAAGESADIIKESKTGMVVDSEDHIAMAEQLLLLKSNPKLRKNIASQGSIAKRKYDRKVLANKMLDIITLTVKQ